MSLSNAQISQRFLTPASTAAGVVALASLLHLLVAGRVALSVDEAHYALYGLHLDWSYYDHPPLVGWLQALVLPLSQAEFALRLWPIALAVVASLLLWRLAQRLFPGESPWIPALAVVALQAAIMFQLVSFALVPEDPLLVCGLAAAWLFLRALDQDRWRDWLWLGVALGLAGLAKYTAVLLVVSLVGLLAVERRWALLRRPGPWVAAVIAALLVAPVFWWNAQHEWISLSYQWGHGAPSRSWSGVRVVRSALGQGLAYGGLALFGAVALLAALREWRHAGVRASVVLAAPLLLVFLWSAGFQETLPHWTLLGWALAAPLAARWVVLHWQRRWVRVTARVMGGYALVLVLVVHSQLFRPWIPFEPFEHPLGDLYGWREAGRRAGELAREQGLPLAVTNWTHGSRIAWYAQAPVQVLDLGKDQFDLWYGNPRRGSDVLLLLTEQELNHRNHRRDWFRSCDELDMLTTFTAGQPTHTFVFLACRDFRGQP